MPLCQYCGKHVFRQQNLKYHESTCRGEGGRNVKSKIIARTKQAFGGAFETYKIDVSQHEQKVPEDGMEQAKNELLGYILHRRLIYENLKAIFSVRVVYARFEQESVTHPVHTNNAVIIFGATSNVPQVIDHQFILLKRRIAEYEGEG